MKYNTQIEETFQCQVNLQTRVKLELHLELIKLLMLGFTPLIWGLNFSVLEVSTGDYGDHKEALVGAIQNGKCNDWRRRQAERSSYSNIGELLT